MRSSVRQPRESPTAPVVRRRAAPPRRPAPVVGRVDDRAEIDADRLADTVIDSLGRREDRLRRQAESGVVAHDPLGGRPAPDGVPEGIRAAGSGRPVESRIRRAVEAHAGRDLGDVRVHDGADADRLSRSLQAEAFTVGSDVFMSKAAARPGTEAGDRLMAHELAHVAQGGTSSPVRRQAYRSGPGPSVIRRSLFGKKKNKGGLVAADSGQIETANGLSKQDKKEQAAQEKAQAHQKAQTNATIWRWEEALKKLQKHDPYDAAGAAQKMADDAQQLMATLPGGTGKAAQVLGADYATERRRLRVIIDECGFINDRLKVAHARHNAENTYLAAGKHKGLNNLTKRAGFEGFGAENATEEQTESRKEREAQGERMGLTKAEIAAIFTFTLEDYKYINPATANSDSWMQGQMKGAASTPAQMKDLKEQGSMHASLASSGLEKLPVWKGLTYRGEALTEEEFDKKFTTKTSGNRSTHAAISKTVGRITIASNSRLREKAEEFINISGASKKRGVTWLPVLWVMEMTNGRDIAKLSGNEGEEEVATLPGAEFVISKVREEGPLYESYGRPLVVVYCKQKK